ncbi:hypothetical protein Y032_0002g1025 [Ancylostoma ceylanicum]|uniref:Uncharacterized protein n=1 Tax=Ancylostoma ceylanicum TaxID=53326 RepID=A0A016VYI8_9BILA|nr:hypothetical protein Y032_0002g1025 [Ancylostoma ceylanicum]
MYLTHYSISTLQKGPLYARFSTSQCRAVRDSVPCDRVPPRALENGSSHAFPRADGAVRSIFKISRRLAVTPERWFHQRSRIVLIVFFVVVYSSTRSRRSSSGSSFRVLRTIPVTFYHYVCCPIPPPLCQLFIAFVLIDVVRINTIKLYHVS